MGGYFPVKANLHPHSNETMVMPFLQAEPAVFRFVTNYSLTEAWRGRAQLITMHVMPGLRNEGVRLVVDEVPYTGPEQTGGLVTGIEPNPETGGFRMHFTEPLGGPQSFILADQLAYCRFSYLERIPIEPFQIWRTEWMDVNRMPRAVRIDMVPLHPDNADLHVSPVSVALPLTRIPERTYKDE